MSQSIDWYFDFISPFAYFQHVRLCRDYPDIQINYRPILFGVVLREHGHKGPAEIPSKRIMTYRYCAWFAEKHDIPLIFPDRHPYKPVAVLRLALAAGLNTVTVSAIFHSIWAEGKSPDSSQRLAELASRIDVNDAETAIQQASVKDQLRLNTEHATQLGIFGVPTIVIDGQLFWGDDLTEMAMEFLNNRTLFDQGPYPRLESIPSGLES